jgi:MFS family permease
MRHARAAAMPFIMITALIDMIAIGLIIPVLPALVGSFAGSQADQAFWYGAVTFIFSLANFFGSPVLGALSDSYGRRPVLLIGFSGLAVSFFATALSTSLAMLIVIRLIGGAMQANLSVANAYVADITPAAERARHFGMLGAMFGLGFILGPVNPCLLNGGAPLNGKPPTPSVRYAGWPNSKARGRWPRWWHAAGSRSLCSIPAGCCTRRSSSAGARWKTAGRSPRWDSPPPSYKGCCWGASSNASARGDSPSWA